MKNLEVLLEDGKLMYNYTREKPQKNLIIFENGELTLDFPLLKSAYAGVFQDFYTQDSKKNESLLNKFLENGQLEPKNITFEYSLSQITYNFKALVDYIWYSSREYKPEGVLQTLDYDHLKDFKCKEFFMISLIKI